MENEIIDYILQTKTQHYRIAYSYVKNKEDALDIIQDTIVKALKYQHTLKHKQYLHTWFCRILINTCKTHLAKHGHYIVTSEGEFLSNPFLSSSQEDAYQHLEIEDALNALNENERTIVMLRYFEVLEIKEIASDIDQNLSTVKSTLYRALKKMKVKLNS